MEILVSRQPVFDRRESIVCYDVSYQGRDDLEDAGSDPQRQFMVDTFLGVGLDRVTDGMPALVAVPRDLLVDESVDLVAADRLIVRLPEGADSDDELLGAAQRLAAAGYRLALTGADLAVRAPAMLELASIVRLDVRKLANGELEREVVNLRPFGVKLLADGVEKLTDRDRLVRMGFELFGGYNFGRPEVVSQKDAPVAHLRIFDLMRKVRDLDATEAEIEETFRTDLSLSYKLLRMVNSAAWGGRGIQSIMHAIRLLGRDAIYRWIALLLVGSHSKEGVRAEIAHTALLRARMCELLAEPLGRPRDAGSFYMAGLMSLLDILLGQPMHALLPNLGLKPEVEEALLDRTGVHGATLRLVEAYDLGQFDEVIDRCAELGLDPQGVAQAYLQSLAWANERAFEADD